MMKFNSLKRLVLLTLISLLSAQPLSAMQFTPWMNALQNTASKMLSGAGQFIQEHKWASAGIGASILAAYAGAVGYGSWKYIQGKNKEVQSLTTTNSNLLSQHKRLLKDYNELQAEIRRLDLNLEQENAVNEGPSSSLPTEISRLKAQLRLLNEKLQQFQKNSQLDQGEIQACRELLHKQEEVIRSTRQETNKLLNQCFDEIHTSTNKSGELAKQLEGVQSKLNAHISGPAAENHLFVKAGLIKPNPAFTKETSSNTDEWIYDPAVLDTGFSTIDGDQAEFKEPYKISTQFITPPIVQANSDTIYLACIHGTFSDNKEFGGDKNEKLSQELLNLGQTLALAYKCRVEFATFNWTGELDANQRKTAGELLGKHLYGKICQGQRIMTVAHSHGCNVVAWAAEELKKEPTAPSIEMAIQIAWPSEEFKLYYNHLKDKHDSTLNIQRIFHLWSKYDMTQLLGSLQTTWTAQRKAAVSKTPRTKIYNIHLTQQADQKYYGRLNHISIKIPAIQHLVGLIFKAESKYDCYPDLSAGLYSDPKNLPRLVIRDEQITDAERVVSHNLQASQEYSRKEMAIARNHNFKEARFSDSYQVGWRFLKTVWGELSTVWYGDPSKVEDPVKPQKEKEVIK